MTSEIFLEKTRLANVPLILVPQYFGSTVFDRRTSKYFPFDAAATEILTCLSLTSIDTYLSNIENSEYRDQIWQFFAHFYQIGFFTIAGKFAGKILDVDLPSDHLVGPLAVHLEVVAACNLKCQHCFAGVLPRQEEPLTLAELDRLFASMAKMGSFRLGLTGGEPLLRPDIFEIIDLATNHGLHPCITTNGLLITEEIARKFGERSLVWLNVSLDGATSDTNDLIRGKGTFDNVVEKLRILSKHTRFTLAFTIMKSNLSEIKQCAEIAKTVGAHTAVFRPLYPVGTAQHHLDLMPSYEDYNQALNILQTIGEDSNFEFCNIDPFSPKTRQESQPNVYHNFGCGAGNLVCSISVSGDMNPCSFLGNAFVAGNLRENSFAGIWHNSQGFHNIRNLPGGDEQTFSGGCRARSLVFNGSINAPDPWIGEKEKLAQEKNQGSLTVGEQNIYHPMTILEISSGK